MFCTNCGEKLTTEAKFCYKCGYMVNSIPGGSDLSQKNGQTLERSILQPGKMAFSTPRLNSLKSLRIYSVIALILMSCGYIHFIGPKWFPLPFSRPLANIIIYIVLYTIFSFGFAITHSLLAIIIGTAHNIKVLKIMGWIGVVLYQVAYIVLICLLLHVIFNFPFFGYETDNVNLNIKLCIDIASASLLLTCGYAFAFVIISFVKSKIKI
jgi:hypothetical protein